VYLTIVVLIKGLVNAPRLLINPKYFGAYVNGRKTFKDFKGIFQLLVSIRCSHCEGDLVVRDLLLQRTDIEERSHEASEQFIVDDRGEEQEGDADDDYDDDDADDNQADEKILKKIAIPNVNKAVTTAVEQTRFIIDIFPLMELGVGGMDIVKSRHRRTSEGKCID
jgi:hypothetical protein